ncbi:MAG: ferritin family protein [Phycisphaerae bacterium]|nr:ferritin family protein [Phycisphaerae bacterium]
MPMTAKGKEKAMLEFRSMEDILNFAIKKEEASCIFYADMAARVADPLAGGLFQDIAQEEATHRQQLQLEIMKLGKVVDGSDDWAENAVIADIVGEGELPGDFDTADALRLAISKEQAAYRLYIDLIRLMQDQAAIDTFVALAEEEVRHKLKFESAYDSYMRQQP